MNDRIDDLIALAALGELTESEAAELDRAAAADPAVARHLADALMSAAAVQTSSFEQPPSSLKASVMDAIAGLPQADPATPQAGPVRAEPASPTHLQPTRIERTRGRRLAPLLAAAAIVAAVAGGLIVATNERGTTNPIAVVVDAADAESRSVSGSLGELELWYSADENAFALVGDSLEPAPTDSTYQVWLVPSAGNPISVGTFEPDSGGSMRMRTDDIDPTDFTVAITVEPAGGSQLPTTPPIAVSA